MTGGSFEVTLDGQALTGWKTVRIPRSWSEKDDSGDYTVYPDYYGDLVLERVFDPTDSTLWNWRKLKLQGKAAEMKKTVVVTLSDDGGTPRVEWEFTNAWPKEYDQLALDASVGVDESAYEDAATEKVTVKYDDLIRTQLQR